MNNIDKLILKKIGLNDKEIEIYLFLLKSDVHTVQQVSEGSFINRTTAYRFLDSLNKKGLIEWIVDERGKKVRATSPENLSLYLKQEQNQLNQIEKILPSFINDLSLIKPIIKYNTQVRYYKGAEGLEQMIWNNLSTREISRSYTVFQRRDFIDPKFEDEFEKEWIERNLKDRVITNEDRFKYINNKLVDGYRETIKIKIIPKKRYYITNDIMIYNDTLAIMSLEKNNLVGVEIENHEIAKTQKSIFDLVWSIAK